MIEPLQKLKDEICRLHRFGHGSEADAVFEATLKAFSLNRNRLNKEILEELLKLEGIRKGKGREREEIIRACQRAIIEAETKGKI